MLVKNSLLYGSMSIIRGILAFLVVTVYTRLLPPADYGDYAILIALIGFFDSFAFMAIRHAIMRHITHTEKETDLSYLANALTLYVAGAALCIAIVFIALQFEFINRMENSDLLFFLGLMVAAEAFAQLVIIMARIRLKNKLFFALNLLRSLLSVSMGSVLIVSGMGLMGAVYAFIFSALVTCALGIWGAPDLKNISVSLVNRKIIREILTFSLPLVLVLSIQSAVTITDRLLLDYMIGQDITGLYAAAQDVPWRLINMLIIAIHIAAYQLAVNKLDHEGEEACKAQLHQNYTLLFGLGLPATIGIIMLAPGLANLFLGEKFRQFFIDFVVFFAPLAFLNSFLQHYFILSFNFVKKNHMMIVPFCGALAITLIVVYIGISHFGVMGAIVASYMAYIFLLFSAVVLARPVFRMPVPWLPTIQIIVSCAIMAIVLYILDLGPDIMSLLISVMIAVCIYGASIYCMNTGNIRAEIKKLRAHDIAGKSLI